MSRKQTKFLAVVALFAIIGGGVTSCVSDDYIKPTSQQDEMAKTIEEIDAMMGDVALAVNRAVSVNPEFRTLIKSEVLKRFDGDTEVLLKDIGRKPVATAEVAVTRSGSGTASVSEMLNYYFPDGETKSKFSALTRSENPNILEQLAEQYPELQISIPVNADQWDPATFTPDVVIRTIELGDEIYGFGPDGEEVSYSTSIKPDVPVIVVGMNERVGLIPADSALILKPGDHPVRPGFIIWEPQGKPIAPANIQLAEISSGIEISWEYPAVSELPKGFVVYRCSDATGDEEYTQITDIQNRKDNPVLHYIDKNYISGRKYYYRVLAYNRDTTTLELEYIYSDIPAGREASIVTQKLAAVSNLTIDIGAKRQVVLNWDNGTDNSSIIRISRQIPAREGTFSILAELQADANNNYNLPDEYRDNITDVANLGQRTIYKVERVRNGVTSDAQQAFIYIPYRDPNTSSRLYIQQIKFNHDIDGVWTDGAPEFYIKVTAADAAGKTYQISGASQIIMWAGLSWKDQTWNWWDYTMKHNDPEHIEDDWKDFTEYGTREIPFFVMYWNRYFDARPWYSSVDIRVEEFDFSPYSDISFTAKAKFSTPDTLMLNLDVEAAAGISVSFDNYNKDCGTYTLNYYDDPDQWIDFGRYGVQLLISEKPESSLILK